MSRPNLRNKYAGKRVLVTGGLGFIGSHLAARLVDWEAEVSIVDNLSVETGANMFNIAGIEDKVHVTIADIRDTSRMSALIREKAFLFNLAGLLSHVGGMHAPVTDLEVNALVPLQILELCRELNPKIRIVFAGTRQVYGRARTLPVNEDACISPVDYNGVGKLAGELYHMISNRVYNLWTTSIRMTNTYGPHMRIKDSHQTFIGWWIRLLMEERALEIFGNGKQIRDPNHVEDVVDALLLSAIKPKAKGKIYNLGGEPINLIQLANLLIELNGSGSYRLRPFPRERLAIDIRDYVGDYSRIQSELGWQPKTDLRVGLKQTIAFYRQNKDHYW
jgi:UDP-glucose 4-epimerase